MKRLSSSLSRLREFFQRYGVWEEPFGDYLFFGKVKFTTVHTTFFMKDYEIEHFLYLFGVKELDREPEELLSELRGLSRELLTLTPDHYLSSFCLLVLEGKVPLLYSSKSLLLGFRGRVEWGILGLGEGKVEAPPQMEGVGRFLTSLCFEG